MGGMIRCDVVDPAPAQPLPHGPLMLLGPDGGVEPDQVAYPLVIAFVEEEVAHQDLCRNRQSPQPGLFQRSGPPASRDEKRERVARGLGKEDGPADRLRLGKGGPSFQVGDRVFSPLRHQPAFHMLKDSVVFGIGSDRLPVSRILWKAS